MGKILFELFHHLQRRRPDGILSLKLFTYYVNQLINKLIACNAGCYFNSTCMCIHNVMYADDICLLAPTANAMQSILDVCYEYGTDNDSYVRLFTLCGGPFILWEPFSHCGRVGNFFLV